MAAHPSGVNAMSMSAAAAGRMDVDELRAAVDGPVFAPGEPGYHDERIGFNLVVPNQHMVIVGATNAADVAAAVEFAPAHRRLVADGRRHALAQS
jgi:hypothetical protein